MTISFVTHLKVTDKFRLRNWRACHANLIKLVEEVGGEWIVPEIEGPLGSFGDLPGCTKVPVKGSLVRSNLKNLGMEHAQFPTVCFVDADMALEPKYWRNAFSKINDYDAFSPYHRYYTLTPNQTNNRLTGLDFNWEAANGWLPAQGSIPGYLSGGIAFFNKKFLQSIGSWDESFNRWGYEDRELDERLVLHTERHIKLQATAYHMWHPVNRNQRASDGRAMRAHYMKIRPNYPKEVRMGSHALVLRRLLEQAPEGSTVVEFGAGHNSTPLLKKACEEQNLTGFCYEGDASWLNKVKTSYESDKLTFGRLTVKNLDEVLAKTQAQKPFLVFVDTGYLEPRKTYRNDILHALVGHAKYVVCHDTEPEYSKVYKYDFSGMDVDHDWLYGIRTSVVRGSG